MPMSPSLSSLTPEELSALSSYPTLPPPPGVMPNFMDPENQNQPLIVVASLLLVIMGAIVLNRAYCKIFIVRKYSWDDCMPNTNPTMIRRMTNFGESNCHTCCGKTRDKT